MKSLCNATGNNKGTVFQSSGGAGPVVRRREGVLPLPQPHPNPHIKMGQGQRELFGGGGGMTVCLRGDGAMTRGLSFTHCAMVATAFGWELQASHVSPFSLRATMDVVQTYVSETIGGMIDSGDSGWPKDTQLNVCLEWSFGSLLFVDLWKQPRIMGLTVMPVSCIHFLALQRSVPYDAVPMMQAQHCLRNMLILPLLEADTYCRYRFPQDGAISHMGHICAHASMAQVPSSNPEKL